MLLLDTSVWIEFLRATGSPADREVSRLLAQTPDALAIAPPITMELLAGAPNVAALASLESLTNGLRSLDLDQRLDFQAAATSYRTARAGGATVRSLVDCLIAVLALRADATVVHRDRDFDVLSEVLPGLRVRRLD